MNVTLWIATGLLAAIALAAGLSKLLVPQARLAAAKGGGWTADVSGTFVKFLGVLEVMAAAGLILPGVTGIAPLLVPVTAGCWVLLMTGAMITHGRRREGGLVLVNLVYLALAVFIAWGRLGPEPFAA